MRRQNWAAITLLLMLSLASVLLVDPRGDFPLNDDWSYAYSVRALIDQGELSFTGWVSMPLIVQLGWGGAFAAIFEPSYTILRVSTLTLGFGLVLATYGLARGMGATAAIAMLAAASVLANPLIFSLSFTFMTDVPFAAFFVASIALMHAGLKRGATWLIALGLVVALMSIFVRQLGFAAFIYFFVAYILQGRLSMPRLILALLPGLAAALIYIGFGAYLEAVDKTPRLYDVKSVQLVDVLRSDGFLFVFVTNSLRMILYPALFLIPMLLALPAASGALRRHWVLTAIVGAGGVVALLGMAKIFGGFPYVVNLFLWVGCGAPQLAVGPLTLRDTYVLCETAFPVVPPTVLWLMLLAATAAAVWLAVLLLAALLPGRGLWPRLQSRWEVIALIMAIAAYTAPLAASGLFDRYIVPVFPLFAAGLAHLCAAGGLRPTLAGMLTAMMLVFSIVTTHDYLEWNRARWAALDALEAGAGIPPTQIDGGFEYNAARLYSDSHQADPDKSWWWVTDDRYVISFNPIPGYSTDRQVPMRLWTPGGAGQILILSRD